MEILANVPALYHFTDTRNLAQIKETGGLCSMEMLQAIGIEIAAPGGNMWSQDADKLFGVQKYVHLCFRHVHPMEFLAKQDGRIQESVFLRIKPEVLEIEGVRFTPDVSNKSGVPRLSLAEAHEFIDYEVLYTRTNWNDPIVNARLLQAEKYEIFVPDFVSIDLITNFPNG